MRFELRQITGVAQMMGMLFWVGLLSLLASGCSVARPASSFRLQPTAPVVENRDNPAYGQRVAANRSGEQYVAEKQQIAKDTYGRPIPLYLKVNVPYSGQGLDPRQSARVEKIGRLLSENPESQALLIGHCDNLGNEQLARATSEQRAQLIKQTLVNNYGISPERMQIQAAGDQQPLVSNANEAGRQRNRRVEVVLSGYYRASGPMAGASAPVVSGATSTSAAGERRLTAIYFKSGETEANPRFLAELDAVGAFLAKNPQAKASIDGYTDSKGSVASNVLISQRRADSIKNYISLRHYIPLDRMMSAGHGPEKPVASNESDAGRQKNRRVEISFILDNDTNVASATHTREDKDDAPPKIDVARSEKILAEAMEPKATPTMGPSIDLPRKRDRFIGQLRMTEPSSSYISSSGKAPSNLSVRFNGANTVPEDNALPTLDALGKALQTNPQARVVIESKTDAPGATVTIARERAEYVKNYLISMYEISPERIKTFNVGPTASVAARTESTGAVGQVEVKVNP